MGINKTISQQIIMQWLYHISDNPPFTRLAYLLFLQQQNWPSCAFLNQQSKMDYRFVAQDELQDQQEYYEQIIYRHKIIPTRQQSWHDLFNAAIWLSFPNSKSELNRQHIEDIEQHGLNPRTPRRNRITHFDECGVLLAHSDTDIPQKLAEHQWLDAFVNQRQQWGHKVEAVIFGHANYEMMLQPFVGLTAKFMSVEVGQDYWQCDNQTKNAMLDDLLLAKLSSNILAQPRILSPLPLLGVPGWHKNQSLAFYQNEQYFMPKRQPS